MTKIVHDDQLILNVHALRSVSKRDVRLSIGEAYFYLDWEFKGSKGSQVYRFKEDRDNMFDQIVRALDK